MRDGSGVRWRIISVLSDKEPQSPQMLAEACSTSLSTVRTTIHRMLDRRELTRVAYGSYRLGDAVRPKAAAAGFVVTEAGKTEAMRVIRQGFAARSPVGPLVDAVIVALQKAT